MQETLFRASNRENLASVSEQHWQSLLRFDWPSVGLSTCHDWDPALLTAVRLIAAASTPMTLMIGMQGIMVPNAPMKTLFSRYLEKEVTGRSIFDVLPDHIKFYQRVFKQIYSGQGCHFQDQLMQLNRGNQPASAWLNLDFTPVTSTQGTVLSALAMVTDVTRQAQRVHTLSETSQRLQHVLELSEMVGIWTLDVKTNLSTADANVARMFGLSVSECERGVDDKQFFQAIDVVDRLRVAKTLKNAIDNKATYRCRYRVTSATGSAHWVVTSGKPILDANGQVIRILGVVVDVTDQVETASALAESRFQFETLTEALPQIVWSCAEDGGHDYFSPRWSEFTGIPREEINEETWKHLVDPEHWEMVSTIWDEARLNGKPYDLDYRFRHHSGEYRWLRVMALPIRDENGRIIRWFGTSTDVHDSYLMAAERERMARELERIASEDQLTEVLTRRAFIERGSVAIEQATERNDSIGLLMMDIDHFKSINDTYGHPGGDQVLTIVAKRIKSSVSAGDLVGRLGGEEFAVLLRDCTPTQALKVADRIRRAIESEPVVLNDGMKVPVSLSVGATMNVRHNDHLSQMLLVADRALYSAKAAGRNRSIFQSGMKNV